MNVAAIILAAGGSTRFADGHKLLAEIDGVPMVRRVAQAVAASGAGDIALVAAQSGGAIAKAAGTGRWRIVENPRTSEGLSTSLRAGMATIDGRADGVLVALADMPGIDAALVDALISSFTEGRGASIVFPVSPDGRQGHPVIWPRTLFAELAALSGDKGGKALLSQHRDLWRPVSWKGAGAFADIDTRDDLAAYGR